MKPVDSEEASARRSSWLRRALGAAALAMTALGCVESLPSPKVFEVGDGRRYAILAAVDQDAVAMGERCDAGDASACWATGRDLERATRRDEAMTLYRRACDGNVRGGCNDWLRVAIQGISTDIPRLSRPVEAGARTAESSAGSVASLTPAAPQPPTTPSPSAAQTEDRLTVLLGKGAWSDAERLELAKAVGVFAGDEKVKFKLERADLDDQPGDEIALFAETENLFGGVGAGVAVIRSREGRSTVLYKAEAAGWQRAGSDMATGWASFSLVSGPQTGKRLLLESPVEAGLRPDAAAPGGMTSVYIQSWTLRAFRDQASIVVLTGTDSTGRETPEAPRTFWTLAMKGGKLTRAEPDDKVVESWTWDAASARFTGTGPNGKWWQPKTSKGKRPR